MDVIVTIPDEAAGDLDDLFPEGAAVWLDAVLRREIVGRASRAAAASRADLLGVTIRPTTAEERRAAMDARRQPPAPTVSP